MKARRGEWIPSKLASLQPLERSIPQQNSSLGSTALMVMPSSRIEVELES